MEMSPEFGAHLTTAAAIVYALEFAKTKLPWLPITHDTKKVNRLLSAVLAAFTSVGITWHYEPDIGRLIVENLTMANLWTALGHWLAQFLMQQVIFDAVVAQPKSTPSPVAPADEPPVGLNLTR